MSGGAQVRLDLGDVIAEFNLLVKGQRRYHLTWHVGAPHNTTTADRVIKGPPYANSTGRITVTMDLQADKKVPLSVGFTDEVGNPVATPEGATAVFTVDDPTIIALTDNGDGTAEAAAVGTLGNAVVHVEVTNGETVLTGDLAFTVIAGDAERVAITAGDAEEVTPDA
jgi:hypothetical protein